jgi:hypothetical protein
MGRGSVRRFASKHGARTFKLVPRSLTAHDGDDSNQPGDDPERVFVEVTPGADRKMMKSLEEAFIDVVNVDDDDEYEVEEVGEEEDEDYYYDTDDTDQAERTEKVGEAAKYGILYDDRYYDYTKHLRTVGSVPGGVIVAAPIAPKVDEAVYWRELKELDNAVYKDIKQVVGDPAVLEVLEALEDEAYCCEEMGDDLVAALDGDAGEESDEGSDVAIDDSCSSYSNISNGGGNSDEELQKILQEMDSCERDNNTGDGCLLDPEDAEIIKSAVAESQPEPSSERKLTTLEQREVNRKLGFAQVDALRQVLRADGPIRVPSTDSEFDSDEYFRELEDGEGDDDDDGSVDLYSSRPTSSASGPQIIEPIRLSKRTGLPTAAPTHPPSTPPNPPTDKLNMGASRNAKETAEEKRARKAAVKSARRERRGEKKENRLLFGGASVGK